MPLQQIGKEYICATRDYNIRIRLSELKGKFYYRVYQVNKLDGTIYEFPYENEVYRSEQYKDINKCEKDMIDFIAENYNVI